MLAHYFTLLIYQPFLNILVFTYWVLDKLTGGNPDMGIAVIIFTVFVRVLLLPLSLSADRSESERRDIMKKIEEVEKHFSSDPIALAQEKKKVLKTNNRVLVSEFISLAIQVSLALMLWRMFNTGLSGEDLHLVYGFMPDVQTPYNLVFLGKHDLTHPSYTLNIIQSILIFVVEVLAIFYSPYKVSRAEVVRLQLVLPVVSFLIFMGLPSGKKLFVITTLCFSVVLLLVKIIYRQFRLYQEKFENKENDQLDKEEKIVVGIK